MEITFFGQDQLSDQYFSSDFISDKFSHFQDTINREDIGFFQVVNVKALIEECKTIHENFKSKSTFVHVGIGGSSLGPEMLISSLKKSNKKFVFINNIDPDEIHQQLSKIDLHNSLFYFCSKSGGTAETMAGLAIVSSLLESNGIQKENFKEYMVFATDPVKSDLLELGKELGVSCLTIPSNVGGRFTVLTPVGFLPALFAGIEIGQLCSGASEAQGLCLDENLAQNQLMKMASFLYAFKEEKGMSQTIFMPYSSKLRNLSHWFVQLWAESLGKELDNQGNVINTGFTPVPAYGATDQHSQVQLFMEGPKDKVMVIISVENFEQDYPLKSDFAQAAFKKLSPYTLGQLMKAELNGTLKALEEKERPYIHINIPSLNEQNLGKMIMVFESLTATMGGYLNINPFDQPGVEAGKKYAFQWLDRPL